MSFIVDTDTCSAYIKGHRLAYSRFMQYGGRLYMSVVTLGELILWASRAKSPPKRLATALVHGYTVVSHNTADFLNVPGLTVVDWLVP